jgi:hypothetical protein
MNVALDCHVPSHYAATLFAGFKLKTAPVELFTINLHIRAVLAQLHASTLERLFFMLEPEPALVVLPVLAEEGGRAKVPAALVAREHKPNMLQVDMLRHFDAVTGIVAARIWQRSETTVEPFFTKLVRLRLDMLSHSGQRA